MPAAAGTVATEELEAARREAERAAADAALAIMRKEEEVKARIAEELAVREAAWAEREKNMQQLLDEREGAARAAKAEAEAAAAEARAAAAAAAATSKESRAEAARAKAEAEAARAAASEAGRVEYRDRVVERVVQVDGGGGGSSGESRPRRRRVSVLHQGGPGAEAGGDEHPYLTVLSRDSSISRSVRITVDPSGGRKLRVGRPGAPTPQDLEIDGVGLAAETAVIWAQAGDAAAAGRAEEALVAKKKKGGGWFGGPASSGAGVAAGSSANGGAGQHPAVFHICPASADALVYVNGRRLQWGGRLHAGDDGSVPLRHDDRVALGHAACESTTYHRYLSPRPTERRNKEARPFFPIFLSCGHFFFSLFLLLGGEDVVLVVDPRAEAQLRAAAASGGPAVHEVSFDSCVHEVMLERAHGGWHQRGPPPPPPRPLISTKNILCNLPKQGGGMGCRSSGLVEFGHIVCDMASTKTCPRSPSSIHLLFPVGVIIIIVIQGTASTSSASPALWWPNSGSRPRAPPSRSSFCVRSAPLLSS